MLEWCGRSGKLVLEVLRGPFREEVANILESSTHIQETHDLQQLGAQEGDPRKVAQENETERVRGKEY